MVTNKAIQSHHFLDSNFPIQNLGCHIQAISLSYVIVATKTKKGTRPISISVVLPGEGHKTERTKLKKEPNFSQVKSKNGGTDSAFKKMRDVEDGAIATKSNDQINIFTQFSGMHEILFD